MIIKDILSEHLAIKEEIAQLPKVGTVIEITKKDKDNYGGMRKVTTRAYKVLENIEHSKLMVAVDLKTNTRECFTHFDLLTSPIYQWQQVAELGQL